MHERHERSADEFLALFRKFLAVSVVHEGKAILGINTNNQILLRLNQTTVALLTFPQRFLHPPMVSNVMPCEIEAHDATLSLIPDWLAIFTYPPHLAVFPDDAKFADIDLSSQELLPSLADDRHVIGMYDSPSVSRIRFFDEGEADHVGKGLGEPFDRVCIVRLNPGGVRIIGNEFGDRTIALFTFVQCFLRPLALSDIAVNSLKAYRLSRPISNEAGTAFDQHLTPIFAHEFMLENRGNFLSVLNPVLSFF